MKKICLYDKKLSYILILVLCLIFITAITALTQEEVINKNCEINWDIFDREWTKYSDIDENLSFDELKLTSRSWQTQQYYNTQKQIVDLKLQIYFLKRDMEIDRQMRLELRAYKDSLVRNIKVNLLKSFWRLAYITYDTVKTGKGLGSSYTKLFTIDKVIPKVGAALKVLKGFTPQQSKLAIDTNDTTGKIKAVAASGALEALESLADPMDTGKEIFNETVKQILPQADLTEEEIKILQDQHLNNQIINQVMKESYQVNQERLKEVHKLEEEVQKLEEELFGWEVEEKQRVADMLVYSCQKNLPKSEQNLVNAYPQKLSECETYEVEICGTWTFENGKYNALWDNGANAVINIVHFDEYTVVFTRHDTTGTSSGLQARYEGKRVAQKKVEGTVNWIWDNRNWSGTWEATW